MLNGIGAALPESAFSETTFGGSIGLLVRLLSPAFWKVRRLCPSHRQPSQYVVYDFRNVSSWSWIFDWPLFLHIVYSPAYSYESFRNHVISVIGHLRRSSQISLYAKDRKGSIALDHLISAFALPATNRL